MSTPEPQLAPPEPWTATTLILTKSSEDYGKRIAALGKESAVLVITKHGFTGRDVERARHICSPTAHSPCRPKRYQMSVVEKRNRASKPKSPSPWKSPQAPHISQASAFPQTARAYRTRCTSRDSAANLPAFRFGDADRRSIHHTQIHIVSGRGHC